MASLLLSSPFLTPCPRYKLVNQHAAPSSKSFAAAPPACSTSASARLDRSLSGHFSSASSGAASRASFPLSSRRVPCRTKSVSCEAVGGDAPEVFQGIYGPWTLEESDTREVVLYRSGLVTAATSFVVAASIAFLPEGSAVKEVITKNLDFLYASGAGGLGLSLILIHIYVTPIKRVLQALWLAGVLGSLVTYLSLAQPINQSLAMYVVYNPEVLWFVGPLFASLTGLVFKEGLCYGKLEAAMLAFVIPSLLLGHLTSLMDDGVKLGFLNAWIALFVVFAARKFTQPVKDDIGDKSVFMFNALPEEEKQILLQKLERPDNELK